MLNTLVYTSQGKSFERFAFEIINKCKNSAKKALSRVALGVKHICVHNPQGGGGAFFNLFDNKSETLVIQMTKIHDHDNCP